MMECTKESSDDFDEIIGTRCSKALEECEEYLKQEFEGKVPEDELRVIGEKTIYKRAVKDTIEFLKYLKLL